MRPQSFLFVTILLVQSVVSAAPGQRLEEVVVTSLKQDMVLQNAPVTIAFFDQDYLNSARIDNLDTLQQHLPGLTVQQNRSPFDSALRIRGIGNDGNIPNFEPDVALYIDGALRVRTGLGMGDLLEVERIEVLKGPQSTLYGKNATAGVINIITPKPEREFSASAELTYGSFNQRRVRGMVGGPVGDSSAYRINLLSDKRDGWIENISGTGDPNEKGFDGARIQYLFEPSDRLSVRLIGSASEQEMICCSPDVSWSEQGLAAFASASATPPGDTDGFNRRVSFSMPHRFDGSSRDFTAIIEYDSPAGRLTSISSYDDYDYVIRSESSYSELDLIRQNDQQQGDTISEELRLNSTSGEHLNWLAGLFLLNSHFERDPGDQPMFVAGNDWAAAGPGLASIADSALLAGSFLNTVSGDQTFLHSHTDTESSSVFGQVNWQFSGTVTASIGARYLKEKKEFDLRQRSVDVNGVPLIAVLADADPANDMRVLSALDIILGAPGDFGNLAAERETDAWTWNAGLNWAISPGSSAYFTASHGFKSGGFNGDWGKQTLGDLVLGPAALLVPEDPADREFGDETVDHLELGMRSLFFDQRLQLNGALFHSDYSDLQSAAFTGTNFIVSNAKRVVVQGIEFELDASLTESLRAYLSAISLDTEYREFDNSRCGDPSLNESCTGYPLPLIPEREAHLGIQYMASLSAGDFYSRLDWSWTDHYSASTDFQPGTEQGAYSIANLNIGWRSERYDISIWVANLTDETCQIVAGNQPLYNGTLRYLNEPRTYGITLRVSI